MNTEHVKIYFSLIKDETGYPPADTESLWAIPLGDNKFCIDSIPFFVVGISYLDIVSGQKTSENILYFENILQRSGHSTIRVILYEDIPGETSVSIRMKELRSMLREIGCSTELSHIPSLVSVDIPPEVPIQKVKEILDGGEQTELWEYEEAALAHTPEAS